MIPETVLDNTDLYLDRILDLPADAKILGLDYNDEVVLTARNTPDEALGWMVVDNEDGSINLQIVEGVTAAADIVNRALLVSLVSLVYYRGEGESPVRYGNSSRIPWTFGSSKVHRVEALAPIGIYTPLPGDGFPYSWPIAFS